MDYPIHAKFTCFKQKGGLILPPPAVLKIDKVAEDRFKKRVNDKDGESPMKETLIQRFSMLY